MTRYLAHSNPHFEPRSYILPFVRTDRTMPNVMRCFYITEMLFLLGTGAVKDGVCRPYKSLVDLEPMKIYIYISGDR